MPMYQEEDYLQLSGIQHFNFCRRQWALIHIENQWAENYRTVDGNIVHEKAHNSDLNESRGDLVIKRGVNVFSRTLGVSGQCDVLEYRKTDDPEAGIPLKDKEGLWLPFPVEYKRGAPRDGDISDTLQLCGQAMCLEEMLCCRIPRGALYYNSIHRRVSVEFTDELRGNVIKMLEEMHALYDRRHTPKVRYSKSCNACSLNELCLPKLLRNKSVADYIKNAYETDSLASKGSHNK